VTRQQDPVTRETLEGDNIVNLSPGKSSSSHIFSAFKLAELEIELGITEPDKKYERAAELEAESEEALQTRLEQTSRVRRAGLRRSASTQAGGVGRLPSLSRSAANSEPTPERDTSLDDSALFN
jgi:hypothetical protein